MHILLCGCNYSFLGLDSQLSLTTHQLDEDMDDCRVLVESQDLNEIVSGLMRYSNCLKYLAA